MQIRVQRRFPREPGGIWLPGCLADADDLAVALPQPFKIVRRPDLNAPDPSTYRGPLVTDVREQPCKIERVTLAKVGYLESRCTTVPVGQHRIDGTLPAIDIPSFRQCLPSLESVFGPFFRSQRQIHARWS
jgi:hypothetical protein